MRIEEGGCTGIGAGKIPKAMILTGGNHDCDPSICKRKVSDYGNGVKAVPYASAGPMSCRRRAVMISCKSMNCVRVSGEMSMLDSYYKRMVMMSKEKAWRWG